MTTATNVNRILNFSAGPGVLPVSVLEQAQRDLMALPGVGMSVLELSHRSAPFEAIIERTTADARELAGIPDGYQVLYLQGGASMQFSMVAMNLLGAGTTADYLVTGAWGQKAVKEARRHGAVTNLNPTEAGGFKRIPRADEYALTPDSAYLHYTSNETIQGVQWKAEPDAGGAPLVCDASSDIFSRPIDVAKYGLIYAGAQKNLGPAGVTLVIVRDDLLKRSSDSLPSMLNYAVYAKEHSLYNTPPCFAIYMVGLVLQWIKAVGGLAAMAARNERKAGRLYAEIDRTGFYRGHADKVCRSPMNVTFTLPDEALEKAFVKESTVAGLDGLKGHRSVGGVRASIYNAFPEEGVDVLVDFMRDFEKRRG